MKTIPHVSYTPELSRLIAAAVVSPDFRQLLLSDASVAIERGYNGTSFTLAPAEQALILSIQASSLADFAAQLVNGHANGHTNGHVNGNGVAPKNLNGNGAGIRVEAARSENGMLASVVFHTT